MSQPPLDREQLLQLPKEQLVELILRLEARVAHLEARLATDSTTSSKPPSSDLLLKPKTPEPNSESEDDTPKRKPGGQAGHKGSTRKGFGRVDRFETLRPECCAHCGCDRLQTVAVDERQVACLVERPIEVVGWLRHTCRCQNCQTTSTVGWPARLVGNCDLDAGLMAMLGWLGNYGHLSFDKQAEFVETLSGWRPSLGTLAAVNDRLAQSVGPIVKAAWQHLASAPIVYVDETPWPVLGSKEWLWQFGTEQVSLFDAGDTRGRAELVGRLGHQFSGTLVCDDFSAYNGYAAGAQQKCLAHLRRHFKKLEKLNRAEPQGLGEAFILLIDEAFQRYGQWQADGHREAFRCWAVAFGERVRAAIETWLPKAAYEGGKLLRSLRDRAQVWWQFLSNPQVRPDNNLSERNLRLAVTKRKVCGGSRSMERFAQTADLLSVIQTCRRQGRSAMEFFIQAIQAAHHAGFALPSLIPKPQA